MRTMSRQQALAELQDHYMRTAKGERIDEARLRAFMTAAITATADPKTLALLGGWVLQQTLTEYSKKVDDIARERGTS